MNIAQVVPTRFAQACEQKLLSSLGKGISKHSERARNIAAGSKRMSVQFPLYRNALYLPSVRQSRPSEIPG